MIFLSMPVKIAILNCYDTKHPKTLFNFGGKNVNEAELLFLRINSFRKVSLDTFDIFLDEFPDNDYDAYVISGSYYHPDRDSISEYKWMRNLLSFIRRTHEEKIPQLGICFGHQMMAVAFGGKVFELPEPEIGFRKIVVREEGKKNHLFKSVPEAFFGVFFHYRAVYKNSLPFGSKLLAHSPEIPEQATAFSIDNNIYAVQFHPERVSKDVQVMFESKKNKFGKNQRFNRSESSDANLKVLENFIKKISLRK